MQEPLSRFRMALSKYVDIEEVSKEDFCREASLEEVSVDLQTEYNSSITLHIFQGEEYCFYSVELSNSSKYYRSTPLTVFSIVDILHTWFPQISVLHAPPTSTLA